MIGSGAVWIRHDADMLVAVYKQVVSPLLVDRGRLRVLWPTVLAGRLDINIATRKKHTPERSCASWRPLIGC